jgi:hypothetical protein
MPWIQRPSRQLDAGAAGRLEHEKPPWGMVYYGLTMKNDGLT